MRHLSPLAILGVLACASPAVAQSDADIVVRMDQLENQMRALTGQVEQLQYRNQQLEQQLRGMQPGGGQPPVAQAAPPPLPQPTQPQPAPQRMPAAAPSAPPPVITNEPSPIRPLPGGKRSDVFDPNDNPNAPGAPRPLGALPAGQPSAAEAGGRNTGAPMDITTQGGNQGYGQQPGYPQQGYPQQGYPQTGGAVASAAPVAPPSQSPRDLYELGIGYVQRKDYQLAEETLRDFLKRYPSDRMVGDVNYWVGESLFQRQRYRDAADFFLTVSTKFDTSPKAPEALLRLGQSLAALKEKETACATFGEVARKYPRASIGVRQAIEREQKRVHC